MFENPGLNVSFPDYAVHRGCGCILFDCADKDVLINASYT